MTRQRAIRLLRRLFARNGYVRWPSAKRLEKDPTYKKGDEIRFVVTDDELDSVYEALDALGVRGGAEFQKGQQWVVPVYGRQTVADLLDLIT